MRELFEPQNPDQKQLNDFLGGHKRKYLDGLLKKAADRTGCKIMGVKTQLKELKKILKREKFKRDQKRSKKLKYRSVKQYRAARKKAVEILDHFETGYSMGDLKQIYIKANKEWHTLATKDERQEYARTTKYKAIHGKVIICMTKTDLDRIWIESGMIYIPGVKTLKQEDKYSKHRVYWEDIE